MVSEAWTFIRSREKCNLVLVIINIAVFLVLSILGNTENAVFMLRYGACYTPAVQQGEYYRLFTAMFLHFGFIHLVYNMICLLAIGDLLEKSIGHILYLLVYLGGGLAGNLLSVAVDLKTGYYTVSAGASGAAFAVIGALFGIMLQRRNKIPRQMLGRMGMMTALMLLQGFTQAGTDNAAHVGGALFGLASGLIIAEIKTRRIQS
ncbi:MAG: rhomboid family intramembrane serine protease [Lachnospiraceae bacterium]|nr:rhomboid family intramembrane serine protease [Lachnospiraceae bacterium]